jgi:fructan beta-fructosidase
MQANRTEPWRPQFHFSPNRNWINDPNGLVWFEGEYHLFFQYNPFGDQWGHMSWGHAVSPDLVNWQELPVAIAEDERASIFSGSVVVDTHNSSGLGDGLAPPLVAIYTGCLRRNEGGQAQELAYSHDRGRTWTKYAHNPVLDLGLRDFRDPKVFWHAGTARWVMAVVLPDDRRAQFYASTDLKAWTLLSEFEAPFEGQGIWECPDLMPLDVPGEGPVWLFKVDVFAGHASGGTGARVFFGQFDGTRFTALPQAENLWADLGADFYAALSWANLPGAPAQAVWLAWMNCHRYAKHLPTKPWRGSMSVPRELSARRNAQGQLQLLQKPVAALNALRGTVQQWVSQQLENEQQPLTPDTGPHADGRALDIALTIKACSSGECGLLVHVGEGASTRVGYEAATGTVFIDRSQSGFLPPDDPLYARRHAVAVQRPAPGQPLRLRVLLDWASVEVFVGDGEQTICDQVFPADASRGLRLYAEGGAAHFGSVSVWPMRAAQMG